MHTDYFSYIGYSCDNFLSFVVGNSNVSISVWHENEIITNPIETCCIWHFNNILNLFLCQEGRSTEQNSRFFIECILQVALESINEVKIYLDVRLRGEVDGVYSWVLWHLEQIELAVLLRGQEMWFGRG